MFYTSQCVCMYFHYYCCLSFCLFVVIIVMYMPSFLLLYRELYIVYFIVIIVFFLYIVTIMNTHLKWYDLEFSFGRQPFLWGKTHRPKCPSIQPLYERSPRHQIQRTLPSLCKSASDPLQVVWETTHDHRISLSSQ